jgi:hypothetical protein
MSASRKIYRDGQLGDQYGSEDCSAIHEEGDQAKQG